MLHDQIISYIDLEVKQRNSLQIPPIQLNNHPTHIPRPAHSILSRQQRREIAAHAAIHGCAAGICLHERRVKRDAVRDLQFRDGHAHHERGLAAAVHGDHWLGKHAAGVGDERSRGGQGNLLYACLIPEGLASEIDRKRAMRIPSQDLLKGNLIDNPSLIKATLPVGEGDCTAAPEPRGNGRDARRVGDEAACREQQIIVYIVAFQRGQTARPSRHIREGYPLGGKCDGRLLRHMDAIFRAAHTVPFKPVVQYCYSLLYRKLRLSKKRSHFLLLHGKLRTVFTEYITLLHFKATSSTGYTNIRNVFFMTYLDDFFSLVRWHSIS